MPQLMATLTLPLAVPPPPPLFDLTTTVGGSSGGGVSGDDDGCGACSCGGSGNGIINNNTTTRHIDKWRWFWKAMILPGVQHSMQHPFVHVFGELVWSFLTGHTLRCPSMPRYLKETRQIMNQAS